MKNPRYPRRLLSTLCVSAVSILQPAAVCLIAASAAAVQLHAQETATGSVQGRVLNASNGNYLGKAVVSVDGSSNEVLTDDFGRYLLREVPVGEVKLKISYTGQKTVYVTAKVEAGRTAVCDVEFGVRAEAGDELDQTLVLDAYVVEASRFRDAQEIAINEERNSVNIKNVVGADSLGYVQDGNIGEFVQFIAGVDIDYGGNYVNGNDASSISVRGFGPEDTNVLVDGMPMSSSTAASLTRAVGLDMLSINNASRIEVMKVATPDMPNDSPGGAINLITRSAFEFARASYNIDLTASMNSMDTTVFKKQPGPANKPTYHTMPGLRFSASVPISDKLGFSASVALDNKFGPGNQYSPSWITANTNLDLRGLGGERNTPATNAQGAGSLANPWLQRASINENPWNTYKQSGNFKVDWKPFDGLTVSSNVQYSRYTGINVDRRVQFRISSPEDWGTDYVHGYQYQVTEFGTYNPNQSTGMTITSRDKEGDTMSTYLKAVYQKAGWTIDAAASFSRSRTQFPDMENGHFSGLDLSLTTGRIDFDDIDRGVPGTISVWDRDGNVMDYSHLSNWVMSSTVTAQSGEAFSEDTKEQYNLNVRREFSVFSIPASIKLGYARNIKDTSKWGRGTGYKMRYTGPALTTDDLLDSYTTAPIYGFKSDQEWASTYKLYDIYSANEAQFDPDFDASLSIGNYNSRIGQTKSVKETADSGYFMLETRLFNNRVSIVSGVRQTRKKIFGYQPYVDSKFNYVRMPNGLVYTDDVYTQGVKYDGTTGRMADGTNYAADAIVSDAALRARMEAAGAVIPDGIKMSELGDGRTGTQNNNLYLAMERYKTRTIDQSRTDPATPQLQAAIRITDRLNLKLSWSRETKLQNLENSTRLGVLTGGNSLNINENLTPDGSLGSAGSITISNPSLDPEVTNSWNSELSYYTSSGGKFSVSYFYKQISNLWDEVTVYSTDPEYAAILESFGMDPADYDNWRLNSVVNSAAKSKRTGFEADIRQNLGIFGNWGRGFDAFVTYSHRPNAASDTPDDAPLGYMAKLPTRDKYTGGLSFSTRRFNIQARAVFTEGGLSRNSTVSYTAPGEDTASRYQIYNVYGDDLKLNLQANLMLSERYRVFASATDILNAKPVTIRSDVLTGVMPEFSTYYGLRNKGVSFAFGLSGSF